LNNFGRGPLDGAIYQNIKALGLVDTAKKNFENFEKKIPCDLLKQPTGTV